MREERESGRERGTRRVWERGRAGERECKMREQERGRVGE